MVGVEEDEVAVGATVGEVRAVAGAQEGVGVGAETTTAVAAGMRDPGRWFDSESFFVPRCA